MMYIQHESRTGNDRRRYDIAPPLGLDRRLDPDRRFLEFDEDDQSEFDAIFYSDESGHTSSTE